MFSCELQVPCKFSLACCRSGNKGLVRSRVCFQHGELYRSLDDWHDYKYNKPIVDSFLHNFHSNIHQVVRGSVELFLQLLHLHYVFFSFFLKSLTTKNLCLSLFVLFIFQSLQSGCGMTSCEYANCASILKVCHNLDSVALVEWHASLQYVERHQSLTQKSVNRYYKPIFVVLCLDDLPNNSH